MRVIIYRFRHKKKQKKKKKRCAVAQILSMESRQGMASINQLRPAQKHQTTNKHVCDELRASDKSDSAVNCRSVRKDVSFHVKNSSAEKANP